MVKRAERPEKVRDTVRGARIIKSPVKLSPLRRQWKLRLVMPEFGYEPRLNRRELRYFMQPIRGERPREYLKSRAYSLRDDWIRREVRPV